MITVRPYIIGRFLSFSIKDFIFKFNFDLQMKGGLTG